MTIGPISSGTPNVLGAHHDGAGVNFAVFSENAQKIELCLFSPDGLKETHRLALPDLTGPVWHGYVEGLPVGALYGFRAHGSYAPERGQRFNPNKLLLDPYTREMQGRWTNDNATLGYDKSSSDVDLSFDTRDSAPFVPKSVVSDPTTFQKIERLRDQKDGRDLIYEAHVKGATQLQAGVAEPLRGTYEGLCSDQMIDHLLKMGVKTVELLPVHQFLDDTFLVERGLTNYWGYNTVSFFTPEPRYFGPAGLAGFRQMVERLHEAGLEVILDVVYNHTAEGDHRGPTLSFRGLDNASYYRLLAGQPRYYVNDSGCGNTLNISHPYVLRMVMDSLRFWVECMGIDGFRFDLATTLGREDHGFDVNGGFFDALRQDPVLLHARLIAEPWDIGPGGYRLGEFPHEFAEWNDGYRDTVRRYWRGDKHSTQDLGARLLGSANNFDQRGRRSSSSINFVSSHDGFTLADTVAYVERHNEANTENNQDGHHANYSDNCGFEGLTGDTEIVQKRLRRQRNMLATLFLSQGTPMMLAGDEFGNSQGGNNNAYCQDNATGWLNWDNADLNLQRFVEDLSAFRIEHPALRQTRFLHGGVRPSDGMRDVEWTDFSGGALQWRDPALSNFCLHVRCSAETVEAVDDRDTVFIVFNNSALDEIVKLPEPPFGLHWVRGFDTSREDQAFDKELSGGSVSVSKQSVVAFVMAELGATS